MSLFDWNSKYNIGCAEIDAQHQVLFKIAGELHQAMLAGSAKKVQAGLLERLLRYTQQHFADEEKRMAASGYPGYVQHRAEHIKLNSRVLDYEKRMQSGQSTSIELLEFLVDWLKHHIQESDQKFGVHMQSTKATGSYSSVR